MKQFGYWSYEQQKYIPTYTYHEAFEKSKGHVMVLDHGKWRGCGLYEIPDKEFK